MPSSTSVKTHPTILSTAQVEACLARGKAYFDERGYAPFPFQTQAWHAYLSGKSGLVNAPTGSGKTFSLILPILLEGLLEQDPEAFQLTPAKAQSSPAEAQRTATKQARLTAATLSSKVPHESKAPRAKRSQESSEAPSPPKAKRPQESSEAAPPPKAKRPQESSEAAPSPKAKRPQENSEAPSPPKAKRPHAAGTPASGLRAIWIAPIRALTKEIASAAREAVAGLGLNWEVGIRSGDTPTAERAKQKRRPPQILITTPESLHLMLSSKGYPELFGNLRAIVVDEWHELMGTKRGVQMELAASRMQAVAPRLRMWGISATIGNLPQAAEVLLAGVPEHQRVLVRADVEKYTAMHTLMPEEIERFPWAGHLGITMLEQVVPIVNASGSTIIFTNTRSQCEIWYQKLLDIDPDLAGQIAMHHGSIDRELRDWVEDAIHTERLKAVVATSSLDLGVDFRPVDSIVQIGSPKGVARFLQRAGRSGHRPGAESKIYFVPTNSLELIEASALRQAIDEKIVEPIEPLVLCFDVLVQYLVTLAVGGGFKPGEILPEIQRTYCFASVSEAQWQWCLDFITTGGESLAAYPEYKKVSIDETGLYLVTERRTATQHRMNMGTIVGANAMTVKYQRGGRIGTVEEWFASQLKPGDVFWFGGRALELIRTTASELQVKKSSKRPTRIPSWQGGRMSLSSRLSDLFRAKIDQLKRGEIVDEELQKVKPLTDLQAERSALPGPDQFLIEYFEDKEGFHLLMYPFEGRTVHEGMAALMAFRLAQYQPISFTIAMNDYGFELMSDLEVDLETAIGDGLFEVSTLRADVSDAINSSEMGRRTFRQIAGVAGLVFSGYPGQRKRDRQLQSSSQLFYDVFQQYEPENLLFRQAQEEVLRYQLQEDRLRKTLERIQHQELLIMHPSRATPFAFPLMVDRLRERFSTERLEDRVARMKLALIAD